MTRRYLLFIPFSSIVLVLQIPHRVADEDEFPEVDEFVLASGDEVQVLPMPNIVVLQGEILQFGKIFGHVRDMVANKLVVCQRQRLDLLT